MPRAALIALLASGIAAPGLTGQERSGGAAWAIEAAGGAIGSAVGFGVGLLVVDDNCGDDLDCIFADVAAVIGTATAGSAIGTWILGNATDTDPSLGGAALGALAGAVAGLGVIKLFDEIDPGLDEGATAVIGFGIAQGAVTALGSRIGAALR